MTDGVEAKLVKEIIISCKQNDIRKFMISTKSKYKAKSYFHKKLYYQFENDTLVKHKMKGDDDILLFVINNDSICYLKDTTVNNYFNLVYDSLNYQVHQYLYIFQQDTILNRYEYTSKNIAGNIVERIQIQSRPKEIEIDTIEPIIGAKINLKNYDFKKTTKQRHKTVTKYNGDTIKTEKYILMNSKWKLKNLKTEVLIHKLNLTKRCKTETTEISGNWQKLLSIYSNGESLFYQQTKTFYNKKGIVTYVKRATKEGKNKRDLRGMFAEIEYLKLTKN